MQHSKKTISRKTLTATKQCRRYRQIACHAVTTITLRPDIFKVPGVVILRDQAKLTSSVMMNAPNQIEQDLRRQRGCAARQIIVRRDFDQIDADNIAALTEPV